MPGHGGRVKRNLAAAAAVAVFAGGGALAATASTGRQEHDPARPRAFAAKTHRAGRGQLERAADYLGLSVAQLRRELRSGKSLAQVAGATPGRSEAGLIEALVAARQARLNGLAARLREHVKATVDRPGGPAASAARGALYYAHVYLGLPRKQLLADLRSGRTLAQVADATPGKSEAGLIEALVAARRETLADALAAGRITQAQAQRRAARLTERVTAAVRRAR
jgi:hypothetical protein